VDNAAPSNCIESLETWNASNTAEIECIARQIIAGQIQKKLCEPVRNNYEKSQSSTVRRIAAAGKGNA
jgi:hypothetical protein